MPLVKGSVELGKKGSGDPAANSLSWQGEKAFRAKKGDGDGKGGL